MIITFECPLCKTDLEVESDEIGAESPCPSCGEQIMIPAAGVSPGSRIGGFEVIRKIGTGGMGEVFLARQTAMDRNVALKILSPAMAKNPATIQRFMQEVRMAGQLEHPHIVTAFDAGEDAGYNYMAMSLVQGKDLDDIVRDTGPMPESQCLHVARKVSEALHYAWTKHHILHRDIKPSNIMIDESGDVKLMDMGIAKSVNEESNMTIQGMLIGTPYYMSPEQAQCLPDLDCRADIYSLGATLYWMLTGTRPFDGDTVMGVIAKVLKDPVPPPSVRNPALTEGCCDLLFAMMAKDREDRYQDWSALIDAIDKVGVSERPATIALRTPTGSGELGATAGLAELAHDPDRTMVANDGDATLLDTNPLSTQDRAGPRAVTDDDVGEKRPSWESQVNPELPGRVKFMLTMGATLLVVGAVVGLSYLTVKWMNERQRMRLEAEAAELAKVSQEQDWINDSLAKANYFGESARIKAEQQERKERLDAMWQYAESYARKNPDDIEGSMAKYEELRRLGQGTVIQMQADDRLRELRKHSQATLEGYKNDLKVQGRQLAEQYRYAEVAELLNPDADGPFSAETRDYKVALASGLGERMRGLRIFLREAEPATPLLLERKWDAFRQRVRAASAGPDRAVAARFVEDALNDLEALEAMGPEVINAIGAQKGQTIDLVLADRTKLTDVNVVGASNGQLEIVANGQLRRLTMADLHAAEAYLYLSKSNSPQAPTMRAISALSVNRADLAAKALAGDDGMIALLLRAEADRRRLAGSWKTARFSGERYMDQFQDVQIAFSRDGRYQLSGDSNSTGTYSLREGAIYLYPGGNSPPQTWTIEWVDEKPVVSPMDGIRMDLERLPQR